jgi:hypothetical protein
MLRDRSVRIPVDIGMAEAGRVSALFSTRFSRRVLLATSGIATLALAACGDESSTRQFAGGPQTPGPNDTPSDPGQQGDPGSPTALPTQMPVAELLAPRGDARFAIVANKDNLTAVEVESGEGREIWSNSDRTVWAVATTPSAEHLALLSAPNDVASGWSIDFIEADGTSIGHVDLGAHQGTPVHQPDAVAAGLGGLAWIGESTSVAVAIPSGGLQQVFADGSQVRLLAASSAKRPAAVAVTPDAGTIAFVDRPSGSQGSGIYAGSMKAKPIDPIVILPADRSGNRYAHDLAWIPTSNRVATIIERGELGNPQGDLFYVDAGTGTPTLAWTSPFGQDTWSVSSFSVSSDGMVVAFLTNPSDEATRKPSSVWVMQIDGGAIERFDLPVELDMSRIAFAHEGVAISGIVRSDGDGLGTGAVFLVSPNGEVVERYRESIEASPVASPVASPLASPVASPEASPSPRAVSEED